MNRKLITTALALLLIAGAAWLEMRKAGNKDAQPRPAEQSAATPAKPQPAPAPSAPSPNQGSASPTRPATTQVPKGSGFDFYVLSLSWSPTFCESGDARDNDQQCAVGRGRGFVVHGLWPQNDNGYPEFCPSSEPERVPASIGRELGDIMPSMGLIGHEWRKHGTCSGLSQRDYFTALAAAFKRVTMPARFADGRRSQNESPAGIERAFIEANPGLSANAVAVTCDGPRLEEVRICMTTSLDFRPCPDVDRRACRVNSLTLPAAR